MTARDLKFQVLIIGAGPSGAACAYWLSKAGWDVGLLEKKRFPREKTCGDGLTPRALEQLKHMELIDEIKKFHVYKGLRARAFNKVLDLQWPKIDNYIDYGVVVSRYELDAAVANNATKQGAQLFEKTEALLPIYEGDHVKGVVAKDYKGDTFNISADIIVVADGSNSRLARSLGAKRDQRYPLGLAIRTYYESPLDKTPWIESHLDLRDSSGKTLPGYGWVFPMGNGRLNIGAGILNASGKFKGINTTTLMNSFVHQIKDLWQIDPDSAVQNAVGGKLPMGLCITPRWGAGWVLIGDALGSINPFNGEGISYAYETGRLAANHIDTYLRHDATQKEALDNYENDLVTTYGSYYEVAKWFVNLISKPHAMEILLRPGMRFKSIMKVVLQVMANLYEPGKLGAADLILSGATKLVKRST
jgi:geranylgeranyl reductase family protein